MEILKKIPINTGKAFSIEEPFNSMEIGDCVVYPKSARKAEIKAEELSTWEHGVLFASGVALVEGKPQNCIWRISAPDWTSRFLSEDADLIEIFKDLIIKGESSRTELTFPKGKTKWSKAKRKRVLDKFKGLLWTEWPASTNGFVYKLT